MKRKSPKLLILTTSDRVGGTERVVINLARQLAMRRWRVRPVFPNSPDCQPLLDWCRREGVDAEVSDDLLLASAIHTWRNSLALRRFVRCRKPDIVNMHYGHNFASFKDVLGVRLAGRHRLVLSIHHAAEWEKARKRRMTRLSSYLADAVVVVSRATRDTLLQAGVPARKIHLIPNGLGIPAYRPSRVEARARLGLPPDAFIVGSLSQLLVHKGIADLIEAAARIPDPDGMVRVVVAGEGPARIEFEALAAERLGDRAIFLGRVPDTADLYAALDVFVLPSYSEGFGLVYVEAAFHGTPSIGYRVGGVPDAIEDGMTGLLVPAGDIPALKAAIQRLWDNPSLRRSLGEAACTRAYGEFTEICMADRYSQVFINSGSKGPSH